MRRVIALLCFTVLLLAGAQAFAGSRGKVCYYVSMSVYGETIGPTRKVCVQCPKMGCPWLPSSEGSEQETGLRIRPA